MDRSYGYTDKEPQAHDLIKSKYQNHVMKIIIVQFFSSTNHSTILQCSLGKTNGVS